MTIHVVNQRQKDFFEKLVALCADYDVTITQSMEGKQWSETYVTAYEFGWNERFGDECNTPDVTDSYIHGGEVVELKK